MLPFALALLFHALAPHLPGPAAPPPTLADEGSLDVVARLARRIESGATELRWEPRHGYLLAVLEELGVPLESQTLVFSRTSLQSEYIGPKTPRALFFGDEVYVGWIPDAPLLELTAVHPVDGARFYAIEQDPAGRGAPGEREECLQCHVAGNRLNVRGHHLRSVHADERGRPVFRAGTFLTEPSSPLEERWGGWYVSGDLHGARHLGNRVFDPRLRVQEFRSAPGLQPASLDEIVDLSRYPRRTSDVVALLVLAHQTHAQNHLSWAANEARSALTIRAALNDLDELPLDAPRPETDERLQRIATRLARVLLGADETRLKGPIQGDGEFAEVFAARGPFDTEGRSLRHLELRRRLFKHSLSYTVYGSGFAALPAELRASFWALLAEGLRPESELEGFEHLSGRARSALRELLLATHPDATGRL